MKKPIDMRQSTQLSQAHNDKVARFQQKLLDYLKSDQISTNDLKKRTGFDEVDLNAMKPELRRPVLAALAAVDEVFRINERLRETLAKQVAKRIKAEKIKTENPENDEAKLVFAPGAPSGDHTAAWANEDEGIHYKPDALNSSDGHSEKSGWNVSAGEGMSKEVQAVLPVILTVLHECGHQYESCLEDECLKALSEDVKQNILGFPDVENKLKKIDSEYAESCKKMSQSTVALLKNSELGSLDTDWFLAAHGFNAFVCRKFMQYAMEQTEKETGKKPIAGLIFKPGGKADSLSLYASANTKDFYAELFAKVLVTRSDHLTPLGKTMRKLLNSDDAEFKAWFCNEIVKDNGKEYKEHEAYCQAGHSGHEHCPNLSDTLKSDELLKSGEDLCQELESFGFVGDTGTLKLCDIRLAIQFNLTSNYNMARTRAQAEAYQKKLANAVTILAKMRKWDHEDKDAQRVYEKCRNWQQAKQRLLLMSEYCGCTDPDVPDAPSLITAAPYSWLDILNTLAEKDPKDFATLKDCERFLDAEIKGKSVKGRKIEAEYLSTHSSSITYVPLTAEREGACSVPNDDILLEMANEAYWQSGYGKRLINAINRGENERTYAVEYLIYKLKTKNCNKDNVEASVQTLQDRKISGKDLQNLDRPSMAKVILAAKKCGILIQEDCQGHLDRVLQRPHRPSLFF